MVAPMVRQNWICGEGGKKCRFVGEEVFAEVVLVAGVFLGPEVFPAVAVFLAVEVAGRLVGVDDTPFVV